MILKINTVALVGVGVGDGGCDNQTRVYQPCTPALYSQQPWPVFLRVLAPAHTAPRYACSRLLCGGSPYLNRWLTFPLSKTKGRLFNTDGSRVKHDEPQPIPHERTEVLNAGADLADASAGPPALGAFGKRSDEWTGTLYLNGACVTVRAKAAEAVNNPYAHFSVLKPLFTSVQKAISLAKGFATRSCHWPRHLNTRYPGMDP
jgi:hypothetical protein